MVCCSGSPGILGQGFLHGSQDFLGFSLVPGFMCLS